MTDLPILRVGSTGPLVRRVQTAVGATVDGVFGPETESAVKRFQKANGAAVDGIVGDETWARIPPLQPAQSGTPMGVSRGVAGQVPVDAAPATDAPPAPKQAFIQLGRQWTPLIENDFQIAASTLGCDEAWVHAVRDVEAGGGTGFVPPPDSRPLILFESHSFHTLTGGQWDAQYPNLSTDSWVRNYGPSGAHQWDRLLAAAALDADAAYKSASYGMFQVMGSNFAICGYPDVASMAADMQTGQPAQLRAFINFCRKTGASRYLDAGSAAGFARMYNGPGYAENNYDGLLQASHDRWVRQLAANRG